MGRLAPLSHESLRGRDRSSDSRAGMMSRIVQLEKAGIIGRGDKTGRAVSIGKEKLSAGTPSWFYSGRKIDFNVRVRRVLSGANACARYEGK